MLRAHNVQTVEPAARTRWLSEYYFSQKLPLLDEENKSGLPTLNFGIGNPDLPPHDGVIEALCASAREANAHGYQPYNGTLALRTAFAKWYQRHFDVTLDPACEILPLLGSKEGILHTSLAYVNPGEKALVPDPGYPTYASATQLAGGTPLYYHLNAYDNWQPDWEQLDNMDLRGVKLMWVNYPNMPTGARASANTIERLIRFGKANNILIVYDNPYSFIINTAFDSILSHSGAWDIAIELNSLSKSHNMPGWRVGAVAGNHKYLKEILKVKSNTDSGMFLPVQVAAVAALEATDEWRSNLNESYRGRQRKVKKLLDVLGCEYQDEQAGLFVWAKIPDEFPDGDVFSDTLLKETGIFVVPGKVFGSTGDKYIRISLCASESKIQTAISRVRKRWLVQLKIQKIS